MKRFKKLSLALALVMGAMGLLPALSAFAQPLSGGAVYWFGQLRDERMQPIPTTTPGTCAVYTAGTDTLATVFTDATLATAKTNPVVAGAAGTSTGQSFEFFLPSTTATVDIVCWTKRARSRVTAYSAAQSAAHFLVLDQQMTTKIIKVPYSNVTSAGNKIQTGVQIPKGAAVRDVLIEILTGALSAHLAIGIDAGEVGGNDAGFCGFFSTTIVGIAGAALGSTGGVGVQANAATWMHCHAVLTQSTANLMDVIITGFHSGALMSRGAIGAQAVHAGSYFRFPFIGNGVAKTLVYTTGPQAGVAATGNFYIIYEELGNDATNP